MSKPGLGHTLDCPRFDTHFPWECDCRSEAACALAKPSMAGDAEALKPCPICSAAPRRNGRGRVGGVLCEGPGAGVGKLHRIQTYGADQAEADAAWNTRAASEHPAPVGSGETLREAAQRVVVTSAHWSRDGVSFSQTAAIRDLRAALSTLSDPIAGESCQAVADAADEVNRMWAAPGANAGEPDHWMYAQPVESDAAERMREAITRAIAQADDSFSYRIMLTRMVEGECTYTVNATGGDDVEVTSHDDGLTIVSERRNRYRADAILAITSKGEAA